MGDKVTLWRAYYSWSKVKVESFEAEVKPNTYRMAAGVATNFRARIDRIELGVTVFPSRNEALQGFMAKCQDEIDACVVTIKQQQDYQQAARELLNG